MGITTRVIAALAVLLVSNVANAGTFTPFVTGLGELKGRDLAQPLSDAVVFDTGLTVEERQLVRTLTAATIVNGVASNIRAKRLVWIKQGVVWTVNLVTTASRVPRQVSVWTDACGLDTVDNFSNANNAWVLIERRGPDGSCFSADDVFTALKVTAGPSAAGKSPVGLVRMIGVYDSAGTIKNFLTVDGAHPRIRRRGADFSGQSVLMTLADSSLDMLQWVGLRLYLIVTAAESTKPGLFYYSEVANSGFWQRYTFNGGVPSLRESMVDDGSLLYFADGNQILRMPIDFTPGLALVGTLPSGHTVDRMLTAPSGTHLVLSAHDAAQTSGGVYSIPRDAGSSTPTPLAPGSASVDARLVAVGGDLAYINVVDQDQGTMSAVKINADGTGSTSTPSAYWSGISAPSTIDFNTTPSHENVPEFVVKARRSGDVDSFQQYVAETGLGGRNLGSIENIYTQDGPAAVSFGIGRFAFVQANHDSDTTTDTDAYFYDTATSGSITPLSAVDEADDYALGLGR